MGSEYRLGMYEQRTLLAKAERRDEIVADVFVPVLEPRRPFCGDIFLDCIERPRIKAVFPELRFGVHVLGIVWIRIAAAPHEAVLLRLLATVPPEDG